MCLSHGKPWIWSPAPKIRKEGQERRLTSLQLLLLFQRTRIQFPAPTQGNSQLQEIPCLQEHLKSCLHITPIYIIKMIKYILNYQKTQSQHTKWEGYRVRHLSPTPTHNVPPAPRAAARGWYYLPRGSQDMLSHKSSHWILGYTGCKWLLSPFTDRAYKMFSGLSRIWPLKTLEPALKAWWSETFELCPTISLDDRALGA